MELLVKKVKIKDKKLKKEGKIKLKNIIIFSGGTGTTEINKNFFKNYKKNKFKISYIVNCYDNGKSTGVLRDIFSSKILGSSDIRKLHSQQYQFFFRKKKISNFFNKRVTINKIEDIKNLIVNKKIYNLPISLESLILKNISIFEKKLAKILKSKKTLKDVSFANIIYSTFAYKFNSLSRAETLIRDSFKLPFEVILNSEENYFLSAINQKNELIMDEESLVDYEKKTPIKDIFITKKQLKYIRPSNIKKYLSRNKNNYPKINPKLIKIINKADFIIYGPGTQYSSLYPTYLTNKLSYYILKSQSKKIYISNYKKDNDTVTLNQNDLIHKALYYLNKRNSKNFNEKKLIDIVFIPKKNNKQSNYLRVNINKLKIFNFENIFYETNNKLNKNIVNFTLK